VGHRCETAEGFVGTIERALANGWNKETVGSHIVRNNRIHHCEQNGIVGSLECAFSRITGNEIHGIHVRRVFDGVEMAGIKFHGSVDVEISDNHIYRTNCGIGLDWMTQGARISRNLLHDNTHPEPLFGDFLSEANHGPYLVDNNIMLSPHAVSICESHSGAFIHNLLGGRVTCVDRIARDVPWLEPHATAIKGIEPTRVGDDLCLNNHFTGGANLDCYKELAPPGVREGNAFSSAEPACLVHKPDGAWAFSGNPISSCNKATASPVNADRLNAAKVSPHPFESPDGTALRLDCDFHGTPRISGHPQPGPFGSPVVSNQSIQVWP